MGMSKLNQYSEDELAMIELLKSMAHPARMRILNYLEINDKVKLRDLPLLVELSRTTIYEHLALLKNQGFIDVYYVKNVAYVFLLKADNIEAVTDKISSLFNKTSKMMTRRERRSYERSKTKTKGFLTLQI
jgi:DNA-binding transcriptional ArsR family regulator